MSDIERPVEILLVEDQMGDIFFTQKAFNSAGRMEYNIRVANDGEEAIRILENDKLTIPDLILLDINLPKIGGMEVLKHIRIDSRWKIVPVVVLSSSEMSHDIEQAYEEGANSYIIKPNTLEEFSEMVLNIERFWFHQSSLPSSYAKHDDESEE